MLDVEFTHHGEDCTFETLLKRFAIEDKGSRVIGEMIHDADLEDDKFHRQECFGLQRLFMGWAKLGLTDREFSTKASPALTRCTPAFANDDASNGREEVCIYSTSKLCGSVPLLGETWRASRYKSRAVAPLAREATCRSSTRAESAIG